MKKNYAYKLENNIQLLINKILAYLKNNHRNSSIRLQNSCISHVKIQKYMIMCNINTKLSKVKVFAEIIFN